RVRTFARRTAGDNWKQLITFAVYTDGAPAGCRSERSPKISASDSSQARLRFREERTKDRYRFTTVDSDPLGSAVLSENVHGLPDELAQPVVILSGKSHLHTAALSRTQQKTFRDNLGVGILIGKFLLNLWQYVIDETVIFDVD